MAQQENAPNKPVHLMYLMRGGHHVLSACSGRIDWVWGYFATHAERFQDLAVRGGRRAVVGICMYRNDRIYDLANEVASELKKVTWPTAKEVRAATLVVIVMAIISAVILGLFDFVWSNLTELVYG